MPEVRQRLAGLSDDRRRLLEQLLKQERANAPVAPAAPAAQPAGSTDGAGNAPMSFAQLSATNDVKANYKRFYDAVNSQLDASVFGPFSFFLNYGYVQTQEPGRARVELPDHFVNKNSVRLVLELIGDCDLARRRVLDVGCGRGGTVYVIKQFFDALSVQGVDLSPNAIAFCRTHHRYDNVRFDEGDAERLPFADAQFDVVTNVESSHSYPNVAAFFGEVARVLAPGGAFCYTDVIPVADIPKHVALLLGTGMTLEVERDITANVLLSCDEVARARVGAFNAANDPELMNNFLAAPGSQVYDDMHSGRWSYRIYRFRKPGGSPADPSAKA